MNEKDPNMQNIKAKVVAITSASSGSEPTAPLLAAEGASLLGALHRAVGKEGWSLADGSLACDQCALGDW
jgi:hypothetical protein